MFSVLDRVAQKHAIQVVIHGAARGADSLAGEWARKRGIAELACPADWKAHGKAAGPIRNQQMINDACPDAAVAFPGGTGTADMVARLTMAGIPVWKPLL